MTDDARNGDADGTDADGTDTRNGDSTAVDPGDSVPDAFAPGELRPSQLYLNAEKLAAVLDHVGEGFDPGVLPVYRFDGDLYLVDGHTRAFVAYLVGLDEVAVEYDADLPEEHDLALYRECLDWCAEAGVERVPDLAGRVLGPTAYEREWIERCHRAGRRLDDAE
jgi:hypothetical protein